MSYLLVLVLHSYLRWGVVVLGVLSLGTSLLAWARGRAWLPRDRTLQRLFVAALDAQVLLGVVLYVALSPLTPRSLADLRAAMSSSLLRFFSVEHVTAMLAALMLAHVGAVKSRSAPPTAARHRRWALWLLFALLLVVVGIPWPFLPYGRPLLRLP
ncbi:MAG: hypothetical protein L0Y64_10345 [Myxococcaceae bacterium]|nr:hypothetical protein [Myxococcaceae bacterium]